MKSKRGLEVSFAWLFALIVGAAIIFIAIFASTKLINTSQTEIDSEAAKRLGILFNPLETSFESGRIFSFSMPTESKIYFNCSKEDNEIFGKQKIAISQKNFNSWSEPENQASFSNKYIFSENPIQGKNFKVFSKPFEMPFKIADLIFIIPSNKIYCFSNSPSEIEEELSLFQDPNFLIENCTENSVKVCFGSEECEINVDYDDGKVEKSSGTYYFETDALMYAAIFSDKSNYECQVERLVARTNELTNLYGQKSIIVSKKGCNSNLDGELNDFEEMTSNFEFTSGLNDIFIKSQRIKQMNENSGCELW